MESIPHAGSKTPNCQHVTFSLLEDLYPRQVVNELLSSDAAYEQRERKLNHLVMVYLLILWSLLARCSLRRAYDRVLAGLRWGSEQTVESTPTSAAFAYRRRTLGVRVLRHLFQSLCRPFAQEQMVGSFAFGLRLLAVDGTRLSVADSPKNRAALRRPEEQNSETKSPFPQMLAALLVEVGTHAIVDAIPARTSVGENTLAWGLLRSLSAGMLLLQDRLFFSVAWMQAVGQRGAHVLGRLSSTVLVQKGQPLSDGSELVTLSPKQYPCLSAPLRLRVISYRIEPKAASLLRQVTPSHSAHGASSTNPDVTKVHRLVTTLLDPDLSPALDLILLYHERWEIELTIDEIKEHQRIALTPLASKSWPLVLQEFYALLLGHYALRVLMAQAAACAQVDPDRISLTHAIVLVTDAILLAPALCPQRQRELTCKVVTDLARRDWLVPERRLRFNSRVVKRSRNRFQIKRPDHVFVSTKTLSSWLDLPTPSFAHLVSLLI